MRRFYVLSTVLLLSAAVLVGCNQSSNDNTATTEPSTTAETQTVEFANVKCPIMGGKPSAELTAQYEGKTIGFCCDGCPEKWAALPDDEKAEKFAAVSGNADATPADHLSLIHI